MNSRVRQIAAKATAYCMEHYKDEPGPVAWAWEDKLVVQECIDVLDPSDDLTSMNEESGRLNAMRILKEHFGVK